MRPDKSMKVPVEDWPIIRALAEAGQPYKEIAEKYNIKPDTIAQRASEERWVTPRRLAKAQAGGLSVTDPASAVAALWSERKEKSREATFQGASKALDRFFAMAPVPQSFSEAAIALKMMDQAITPPSEADQSHNINIAVLTQAGFAPKPVVDV